MDSGFVMGDGGRKRLAPSRRSRNVSLFGKWTLSGLSAQVRSRAATSRWSEHHPFAIDTI